MFICSPITYGSFHAIMLSWVVATEAIWPSKSEIFTIWPFREKVWLKCLWITSFIEQLSGEVDWQLTALPVSMPFSNFVVLSNLTRYSHVTCFDQWQSKRQVEAWNGMKHWGLFSGSLATHVNRYRLVSHGWVMWTRAELPSHSSWSQPRLGKNQGSQDHHSCLADPQLTMDTWASPAEITWTQPDHRNPKT